MSIIVQIHNQYYDLTDFNHPGGPVQLMLSNYRDATEMFESHHLFENDRRGMKSILDKYRINQPLNVLIPKSNIYDWELTNSDPFTKELKEQANLILKRDQIKADGWRWFEMIFLSCLFYISLYYFIQGYWLSLFLTPILAWIKDVNTFHDASHFAVSNHWLINQILTYSCPWATSPLIWYHQHIAGHHMFPNIPNKDPDQSYTPQLIRHTKTLKHADLHQYQTMTFILTWLIDIPLLSLRNAFLPLFGNYEFFNRSISIHKLTLSRKFLHISGRMFNLYITYLWPFFYFELIQAVIWAILPICIYSFCYMIFTQINHLTPENVDITDKNFYKHQIKASHNVAPNNYFLYILTGGLNLQIEHHLFPSVNHCHLIKLAPMVKQLCHKYDIPYNHSPNLYQALQKHYQHLFNLSLPGGNPPMTDQKYLFKKKVSQKSEQ